jgi:uncharacterized protein
MAQFNVASQNDPLLLMVPGLNNSGPDHWQTKWEAERDDCLRVDLGMWDKPHRNTWVNKLGLAIHKCSRPVILVAHSLGCYAVAWWALYEQPARGSPVIGALLVAPPDVDSIDRANPLACFAPTPEIELPFDTIVVASHDDHYMAYERARSLAKIWGGQFADAGRVGHINADSALGNWPFGSFLLDQLIARTTCKAEIAADSHGKQNPYPPTERNLVA